MSKFRLLLDVWSVCGFVSLLCRVFCQDRAAMPQNHLLLVYRYVVLCKAGMLAQDSMCKSLKRPVKDTHKLLHWRYIEDHDAHVLWFLWHNFFSALNFSSSHVFGGMVVGYISSFQPSVPFKDLFMIKEVSRHGATHPSRMTFKFKETSDGTYCSHSW